MKLAKSTSAEPKAEGEPILVYASDVFSMTPEATRLQQTFRKAHEREDKTRGRRASRRRR